MFGRGRRTLALTRLPGLPVLDARAARQAGVVSEVLIASDGRVAAVEVQHGDGHLRRQVPAERIEALRGNMVVVSDAAELSFPSAQTGPDGLIGSKALVGLPVVNEHGGWIGRLADAHVDLDDLRVATYTLARPLWQRWRPAPRLHPEQVVSCSPVAMVVRGSVPPVRPRGAPPRQRPDR